MPPVTIGILALQGAFREHRRAFARLGVDAIEVRLPRHLDRVDALVVPGGESTTMAKLMLAYQLDTAIAAFHADGGAVWGTCAGAILIAREVVGRPDQPRLNLIDLAVARNAYGRQVASFEADLTVAGLERPFRGVFIRAPRIVATGPGVEVLARHGGDAVAAASGRVLATVFHPELAGDDRLHALFLDRFARPAATAASPMKGRA
jgi:5'-phosphate synthase pdxT subunit